MFIRDEARETLTHISIKRSYKNFIFSPKIFLYISRHKTLILYIIKRVNIKGLKKGVGEINRNTLPHSK